MKRKILLGLCTLIFSSATFSQDDFSKFKCNLKKWGDKKSVPQVHIIEIPKNTNGRFEVIHNGKAELAQSYSNGRKIRWGYGVELNLATYEYFFGGGDVDKNKLQELRETSGDSGIVWNFDFDSLEFQENFDDGDERGMGEKILKEGSCENLGFKPTKTYTDLVGRVQFFTKNYARDYYKKIFSETNKHPIHSSYKSIATEIIEQNDGGKVQANMLVDLVAANPYNKDDSRPYYSITFMTKLFNSKIGDENLKPLNNDYQYVTAFVKCNVEPNQIRFTELYNKEDYDDRGYKRGELRFNIDDKYLINYVCAHIDALNKSGY